MNDVDLSAATNSSLTLTNVKRASSGNYSILVTNIAGSIKSSNAVLKVHVPQRLEMSPSLVDGNVVFRAHDSDGAYLPASEVTNFGVQASSDLRQWTPLTNSLVLTNGELLFIRPGSTNALEFYRLFEAW